MSTPPLAPSTAQPEQPHMTAPDLMADPFGGYGRLRELAPIVHGIYLDGTPAWFVTRYDEVREILHDGRFVNNPTTVPGGANEDPRDKMLDMLAIPNELRRYLLGSMLDTDPPEHTRLRKLVLREFTARRILNLRPQIENIAKRLLERLPDLAVDGVVDLLAYYGYPLSIQVICDLVGVPESEHDQWLQWGDDLINMRPERLSKSFPVMIEHTHRLVADRRAHLGDDLLSGLIRGQDEDGRVTDIEMVTFVVTLVLAGHETTSHLISNGTAALLSHPDQLKSLRSDLGMLPTAIHELMRWSGSVHTSRLRYATEDVEIAGTRIARGDAIMLVLVSANFDPRHYTDPDRFDLTRSHAENHVGFGHGMHYCLGASLARLEAEIGFRALLERFPNMSLALEPPELERQERLQLPGNWRLAHLPLMLS